MIMAGRFTQAELKAAASRVGTTISMVTDVIQAPAPWTVADLRIAAMRTGYNQVTLGEVIQNARAHKAAVDAVFEKITIAGEDDVITARELREALVRLLPDITGIVSTSTAEGIADRIMKDAADRREPEYSPRTVVKDTSNTFYERTISGSWLMFGFPHPFADDHPLRPLEVIYDPSGGS